MDDDAADIENWRGWRSRWTNRSYAASDNVSDRQRSSQFDVGALGSFGEPDIDSLHSGYSPSIDPGATFTDAGGLSSHLDDATALSHAFIDRQKPFMSKMPCDPPAVQSLGCLRGGESTWRSLWQPLSSCKRSEPKQLTLTVV